MGGGEYEAIAGAMAGALGRLAVRIDHIGSTSVPGLAAKDNIDVQVTVRALEPAVETALRRIGYTRPEGVVSGQWSMVGGRCQGA